MLNLLIVNAVDADDCRSVRKYEDITALVGIPQ